MREGLVAALGRMLRHARKVSANAAADPEAAVHAWRKSLRRARSVVRFARPLSDARRSRAVLAVLAAAMRETSSLRDAHVLEATLARVPEHERTREVRARLQRALEAARKSAGSPERVLESLGKATARLDDCEERFEASLARDVEWRDVEESLRRSHRRVRRAWKGAEKSREDAQVHEWRKRTKELRYELEMLASAGAPWVMKQHRALVRLAESLGEATDLMVLADYVRAWDEGFEGERALLLRQVRKLVNRRLKRALVRAEPVLARRPKRFAAKALSKVRPADRAA